MRSIGEVRQARLRQLIAQTGLSFADVNEKLGRNRRDATLNQVAQAAKNTSTGKPRRMGDTQARLIETALKIPEGWFDTDPHERPDIVVMDPDGSISVVIETEEVRDYVDKSLSSLNLAQPTADYGWPFKRISIAEVNAMPQDNRDALERVMLAFMGSASALPEWRPVALKTAAKLDRDHKTNVFTNFVRAVEQEMQQPAARNPTEAAQ